MTRSWVLFLGVKLPAALLTVLLLAEAAAWGLASQPRLRHGLDTLAQAVTGGGIDAPVVLAGDSVTQDVMGSLAIFQPGQVANLTTNKASGPEGIYLLLRRYLEGNRAPEHLIIAATPEFTGYAPDPATRRLYLETVFERGEEQAWLGRTGELGWKPAVMEVEDRLFDRMVSLARGAHSGLVQGVQPVADAAAVEGPGGNAAPAAEIAQRVGFAPEMAPRAALAWRGLCELAGKTGIQLHMAWAPAPASAHAVWMKKAVLAEQERLLRAAGQGACDGMHFSDFNTATVFPDHAFRDPDHLRRPGWVQRYGALLRAHVAETVE